MKNSNRILSFLLVLTLVFSLMSPALAADSDPTDSASDSVDAGFTADDNPDSDTTGNDFSNSDPTDSDNPDGNDPAEDESGPIESEYPTDSSEDYGTTDDETYPEVIPEVVPEEDLSLVGFKDVKSSDWFYADVTNCAKLGIVAGFEDGTFKPNDSVTGVQFAAMLTRTFYNKELDKVTVPSGQKWYYQYVTCAKNVGISDSTLEFKDANINRNDMARALYNIIAKNNKLASNSGDAASKIKDYNSIPANRRVAVCQCYTLGIIMGMSDGTFSGTLNMTRAQACTVIMRMLKLINNYNPGDLDNDEYDDGKSQDTGNNNQTSSGKTLANGKPVTVDNVSTVLEQLKTKYPNGMAYLSSFCTGGSSKAGDFKDLCHQWSAGGNSVLNLQTGCGGFARAVSDAIFGETGFPARRVTDGNALRPGDIIVSFEDKAHTVITHVSIVCVVENRNGTVYYGTCGNTSSGGVKWATSTSVAASAAASGNYLALAYTRYPA